MRVFIQWVRAFGISPRGQAAAEYGAGIAALAGAIALGLGGLGVAQPAMWLAAVTAGGWLGALCARGGGYGLVGNAILGLTGGFLGALLLLGLGVDLPAPPAGWAASGFAGGLVITLVVSAFFER